MAYEGFQLLSYDYEDIDKPKTTLPKAMITAVISVIFIYILVSLGATMLVGAETIIEKRRSFFIAGQKAMGTGLILCEQLPRLFNGICHQCYFVSYR
ncbi:MAG: amino acid permease [Saprospiraceae bacterium]